VLREIYVKRGWARRAFTWHEAADTELYRPMPEIEKQCDSSGSATGATMNEARN
jgi:spore maturation protein CgeB